MFLVAFLKQTRMYTKEKMFIQVSPNVAGTVRMLYGMSTVPKDF